MTTKRKRPGAAAARRERSNGRSTPAEKLASLKAHAKLHGIKPIDDPDTMIADFWPACESVDGFVAAVRGLRRQDPSRV